MGMMKILAVVFVLTACIPPEPLRPGQTRCESKRNVFGVVETECETGQPAPPPARPQPTEVERTIAEPEEVHGFWCSTSASDYTMAVCARKREACTQVREDGPVADMSRCEHIEKAWCNADDRCGPTSEACFALRSHASDCREMR